MRKHYDAILVGGGIMSSTLAVLLRELDPKLKILVIEKNSTGIQESTGALSNAGTGHQGFCELNYTPMDENGKVDIKKAIKVCESFEKSKQFWSYLKDKGHIGQEFIHSVPHISVVHGQENVNFLKKRYEEMKKICLFSEMEFSDNLDEIESWAPLITKGRDRTLPIAATRMKRGTDIDFGQLASDILWRIPDVDILSEQTVIDINRNKKIWFVTTSKREIITTDFVFIGAGGATLPLLQKSGIPEASQYGGFPVSGQWLVCDNPEVVKHHTAKVYGKPSIGAPPMSVPHLDTRYINGKKVLLFGPYAGFSTKFLKGGSWLDLFSSITLKNIGTMLSAGARNIPLTKYLIKEIFRSKSGKFKMLKEYYPDARLEDWKLSIAGQRVQTIKNVDGKGEIEFGTEIVTSSDGSLAALLGASPGGSVSVHVMLQVIQRCFKHKLTEWNPKIEKMIPSYSMFLAENEQEFRRIEDEVNKSLGLNPG
jgi:malate dehydrogenase (quinone)